MKTKAVRSTAKSKRPPTRKSNASRSTRPAPAAGRTNRVRTDCDFLRPIA